MLRSDESAHYSDSPPFLMTFDFHAGKRGKIPLRRHLGGTWRPPQLRAHQYDRWVLGVSEGRGTLVRFAFRPVRPPSLSSGRRRVIRSRSARTTEWFISFPTRTKGMRLASNVSLRTTEYTLNLDVAGHLVPRGERRVRESYDVCRRYWKTKVEDVITHARLPLRVAMQRLGRSSFRGLG